MLHFTPEGKLESYTLNTSFPDERARLDPAVKGGPSPSSGSPPPASSRRRTYGGPIISDTVRKAKAEADPVGKYRELVKGDPRYRAVKECSKLRTPPSCKPELEANKGQKAIVAVYKEREAFMDSMLMFERVAKKEAQAQSSSATRSTSAPVASMRALRMGPA